MNITILEIGTRTYLNFWDFYHNLFRYSQVFFISHDTIVNKEPYCFNRHCAALGVNYNIRYFIKNYKLI